MICAIKIKRDEEAMMIMTHAEEIARVVASIIKEKRTPFARADVRDKLDISHEEWLYGYSAIFQGMRIDHPDGVPNVGSKFEGVFKRVGYGIYELTEYGEKLIKDYDC